MHLAPYSQVPLATYGHLFLNQIPHHIPGWKSHSSNNLWDRAKQHPLLPLKQSLAPADYGDEFHHKGFKIPNEYASVSCIKSQIHLNPGATYHRHIAFCQVNLEHIHRHLIHRGLLGHQGSLNRLEIRVPLVFSCISSTSQITCSRLGFLYPKNKPILPWCRPFVSLERDIGVSLHKSQESLVCEVILVELDVMPADDREGVRSNRRFQWCIGSHTGSSIPSHWVRIFHFFSKILEGFNTKLLFVMIYLFLESDGYIEVFVRV